MKVKSLIVMVGLLIFAAACSSMKGKEIITDPFYESFYEKTRLIMSSEEKEIYKHLPDQKSKEEFIEEFWKKRDPNPETEENEVKAEFEERIAYANRWFNEGRGRAKGWDTERGRILLQLGFPEERYWGDRPITNADGALMTTKRLQEEVWVYYTYQMVLRFRGDSSGFGSFKLRSIPTHLRTALDTARDRLDLGNKKPKKDYFKFEAKYDAGNIQVNIPTKRISFEDKDGTMTANFTIDVTVYKDYVKLEHIEEQKSISMTQGELLDKKEIGFSLPYSPKEKGTYVFDIIVTDKLAEEKFRNFTKKSF